MDTECKYLKIKDVTSWHGDVFDHPTYEYFCTKQSKELLLGELQCRKCSKYEEKQNETLS